MVDVVVGPRPSYPLLILWTDMIQVTAVEEVITVAVVASPMAAAVDRMAVAATLNKAEKAVEEETAGRLSRMLVRRLAKLR